MSSRELKIPQSIIAAEIDTTTHIVTYRSNSLVPVEITDGDATFVRVQNTGDDELRLAPAVSPNPVDFNAGSVVLAKDQVAYLDLEQLWPGIPGANRVFAICSGPQGQISVSHA